MAKNKALGYKAARGKDNIRSGVPKATTSAVKSDNIEIFGKGLSKGSVMKDSTISFGNSATLNVYNLLDIQVAVKAGSDFDYISLGQTGITKHSIDNLAKHIGMSRKNVAEEIFDVSVKTLERKATTDKLDKKISSHAIEIAKVLQHANEVFGDEEKVRQWLNTNITALNNSTPVSFFDTLTGLNMVNDILTRIEEGVYS